MTILRVMICFVALLAISMPTPSSAAPQKIYPILSGSLILGGSQAGKWVDAATTAAHLQGGERYRLYRFRSALGTASGSKVKQAEEIPHCLTPKRVTLSPQQQEPFDIIAVGGDWKALPRVPQVLSPQSRVYRQAVADILRANGIAQPKVTITRIVRVDLEGDGVNEVLISATHRGNDSVSVEAGDYSLLVLRKVVKGAVVTLPIAAAYFPQAQETWQFVEYKLQAVLDLNGDGVLEPVVQALYFESDTTTVYSVRGTQVSAVLKNGCGV